MRRPDGPGQRMAQQFQGAVIGPSAAEGGGAEMAGDYLQKWNLNLDGVLPGVSRLESKCPAAALFPYPAPRR